MRREDDARDRRLRAVTLTPEGRHLVDAVLPDHVANEERLLQDLNASERKELARLLEKLAVALHDTTPEHRGSMRPRAPARGRVAGTGRERAHDGA